MNLRVKTIRVLMLNKFKVTVYNFLFFSETYMILNFNKKAYKLYKNTFERT